MSFHVFTSAILTVLTALLLMPAHLYAQAALDPYYARLSEMNRSKPYQNPQWDRFDRVQKNTIVDSKNKVIGSLKGLTLGQNGIVESLHVDLNRIKLGQTTLNYKAMQVRSGSASYILGFDGSTIKDNFASMLANVEPASGDATTSIPAAALRGASLEASDGRKLGRVEEIMFSKRNDRAEALVVSINHKGVRASSLALPFTSATFEPIGNTYKAILDSNQADNVLSYASKN